VKLGLIADVHANPWALQAVMETLHDQVDLILFGGDFSGYYSFINECAEMWDSGRIVGVRGNHDEVLLNCLDGDALPGEEYNSTYGSALKRAIPVLSDKASALLRSWPKEQHIKMSSVSLSIFHGAPWDPLQGRVYPDFQDWSRFADCTADIIVLGHTHYAFVKYWKGKIIINPGSVGQARDMSGSACYSVVDLAGMKVTTKRIEFNPSLLIEDAKLHDANVPYLIEVLQR
jgi:putative phosphoesterase